MQHGMHDRDDASAGIVIGSRARSAVPKATAGPLARLQRRDDIRRRAGHRRLRQHPGTIRQQGRRLTLVRQLLRPQLRQSSDRQVSHPPAESG
jgi:hypothetical protein